MEYYNAPTSADYASHDAQQARRQADDIEAYLTFLARRLSNEIRSLPAESIPTPHEWRVLNRPQE